MCFGRKDEIEDALAPRPPQQRPSSVDKGSSKNKDTKNSSSEPFSMDNQQGASSSRSQAYAQPPQPQYVAPYVDVTETADQHEPMVQQSKTTAPPTHSYADAPPMYDAGSSQHDWQAAVPDTSLFPPPPAIFSGFYRSPTSNATEDEAEAGEAWCASYPLTAPLELDDATKGALHFHNIRLMEPVGFNGRLTWQGQGRWYGETAPGSPDRCIISYPPLYAVKQHSPNRAGNGGAPRTVYYEARLLPDSPGTFLALGFAALPYPSFRMPGWHRGSLAVHGDDGHKYINDRWGGKAFTVPFQKGETYGIGMTIKPSPFHNGGEAEGGLLVDVFFTRNGTLLGGWNIHEETDAQEDLPVTGLEGFHDLCASIGTYDGLKFEAVFEPSQWLYKDIDI